MTGGRSETRPLPEIVGHRGAAAVVPENTVASFRRGIADGSAWLECDVHLSADGLDAVIHDATIDRTAQENSPLRTGAVADFTRKQLDTVLVGDGEPIPTLSEVLDAAVRHDGLRIPLLVEIKAPAAIDRVLAVIGEYFGSGDVASPEESPVTILSFHEEPLRVAQERAPWIPRMRTTGATSAEFWESVQRREVTQVGVQIHEATPEDVARAKELGMKLNLWTARTSDELMRALDLGCDTITVDDPMWAQGLMTPKND